MGVDLFQDQVDLWEVANSKFEGILMSRTKIENSTQPKLILLMDQTANTFILKNSYYVPFPHKYAIGSFKFWYSDDDFSDGSTLTLEIFITSDYVETMEELKKPCLTMKIPSSPKQIQPHFEYIHFGEKHSNSMISLDVKVSLDSQRSSFVKPKSLGLRDLRLYFSNELLNVTYPSIDCPLGQALDANLICQDCAANCDACFGTKPSQCFSCSSGSHWHDSECINCHGNCGKCTGPTQHECLGCNFGFFNYGNGTCLKTCNWPFHEVSAEPENFCLKVCKPGEFLWNHNKTCIASCPAPFISSTDGNGVLICESPCSDENDFLYMNGSCIADCQAPFVIKIDYELRICKSPCKSTSDFLFANGSCSKECPYPLQIRSDSMGNYCVNPCPYQNRFLYTNGSCLANCQAPLVTASERVASFCINPCKPKSEYLSFDRTCLNECPAPLQIRSDSMGRYCVNPCQPANLYLYNNGSCLSTCPAPLVAELKGWVKFCRNPCKLASDYLYANRSCLKVCLFPLQIKSDSTANYCVNPCAQSSLYLYSNGSCLSTCLFPGKMKEEFGVKYCLPPCSLTREYILRDGSCSKECPVPLIRKTVVSVGTLCLNPCESDAYFISGDGSCLSNCPNNFETRMEYGVKYCIQPCLPEQYYFPRNRSCLDACPYPLMITSQEGMSLCQDPCSKSSPFLYDDQSCHERCALPLIIEERNRCKSPCLGDSQYVNADGSCQETCEYPYEITMKGPYKICQIDLRRAQWAQVAAMREITKISNVVSEVGGILGCFINTEDPTSLLMAPLLKMFQEVIYTKVLLPWKTELILGGFYLEDSDQRLLSSEKVRFQKGFNERVVIMVIFSGAALLISGLLKLIRSSTQSKFYQLLVKCDFALRWNTMIPLFIGMSGDIYLSFLIELQNQESISSIHISLIVLSILVLSQIWRVSQKRREADLLLLSRWRFLYEIFSESQRFFILSHFARLIVYHLVIGLLSESPRFQAFLMVLMSSGMCFYLIWVSPIAKRICKIQYLVAEFALLFNNFIFGILATFDLTDGSAADICGQLMSIVYLITSVITAILIVMKIIQGVYSLYKTSRTSQTDHIQLSEMSQESDPDSPQESVRFEPLNQEEEEGNSEDQNNFDSEDDSIEPSITIE